MHRYDPDRWSEIVSRPGVDREGHNVTHNNLITSSAKRALRPYGRSTAKNGDIGVKREEERPWKSCAVWQERSASAFW
jgi:hypothetical protein